MKRLTVARRRKKFNGSATARVVLALLMGIVFSGCPDILGNHDIARIVPQKSIDRVQMRDSRERVEEILGEPNSVMKGDFPGVLLDYASGTHSGMRVTVFSDVHAGVVSIRAIHPYDGRTPEGHGIGSSREAFLKELGTPSMTHHGEDTITDYYDVASGTFFIKSHPDGVVHTITLHIPTKERIPSTSK